MIPNTKMKRGRTLVEVQYSSIESEYYSCLLFMYTLKIPFFMMKKRYFFSRNMEMWNHPLEFYFRFYGNLFFFFAHLVLNCVNGFNSV